VKINLFDENGVNKSPVSGHRFPSQYVKWIIGNKNFDGITIFTDKHIIKNTVTSVKSKIKIAWLIEPKVVYNSMYSKIIQNEKLYNYIFTYDKNLLQRGKQYIYVPAGGTWIPINNQLIYPKTKLISSVVSKKNMFPGHKIRHAMCDNIKRIDYYGSKFQWIATKDIGIKDYMFSVAIENSSVPNYFTEKIIDCFLCGAVPVYWGCSNIEKFFNPKGIITFSNVNDLKTKTLPSLTKEKYEEMKPYVEQNFEAAKKYIVMIDWIHNSILVPRGIK